MKRLSLSVLFLATACLIACASPNVGQQLPPGNYPKFEGDTGFHAGTRGPFYVSYMWRIDRASNKIDMEGAWRFMKDKVPSRFIQMKRIRIGFGFLDENRKVISEGYVNKFIDADILKPIPFRKEFPFNPATKSVCFSYDWEGREQ